MSDLASFEESNLSLLSDGDWRRLGVTQTFERLLVEATAVKPGSPAEVAAYAGRSLSGGGAKFWDLSRANLQADLCRKRVLIVQNGALTLHDEFSDRLRRLIDDVQAGVSHVKPTPGVTIESIMEKTAERERRQSKTKPRAAKPKARATTGASTPKKRLSNDDGESTTRVTRIQEAPSAAPDLPAKKIFTSIRVNRMQDHLDNNSLSTTQLGERLDLKGKPLSRFLDVTEQLELTRVSRDNLVDLHWRGREVARTTSADRRMTVLGLVDELREAATKSEE